MGGAAAATPRSSEDTPPQCASLYSRLVMRRDQDPAVTGEDGRRRGTTKFCLWMIKRVFLLIPIPVTNPSAAERGLPSDLRGDH